MGKNENAESKQEVGMYSGVLEREYVKKTEDAEVPEYFSDLNLNQIIRELQEKAKDYNIRRMYYRFPKDYGTVCYRQDIYREIRGKQLERPFLLFSKQMRETRRYLECHKKAEDKQQYQMYWFDAVREFVTGVNLLGDCLSDAKPESEGLAGLLRYVEEVRSGKVWKECMTAIEKLQAMMADLRFELSIDGANLKVRPQLREQYYFDSLKKLFPDKFSEKRGMYGIPEDYLIGSPFAANETLGYLEAEIVRMYRKIRPGFFDALKKFYKKYETLIDEQFYRIEEELQFYLVFSAFQTDMEAHGCIFCEPEVRENGAFTVREVYDLALARKNRWVDIEVVSNSVQYEAGERFFVVTGPNQGGKTTFARSLGQLVYFAMMGLTVPAESAEVPYFENLLTHFSVEESPESGRGKLKEELVRLTPMMKEKQRNSFVILNELFTTAATYDAFVMGKRVICHFAEQGCLGVYVTHISELTKAGEYVVSLVALADKNDHKKRTFRIARKEAEGTGYAGDIVEKHHLGYEELCSRLDKGGVVCR